MRDALDRADVVGDVLTGAPVAAGRCPHEATPLVEQVDGQSVDLELTQVVVVRPGARGYVTLHPRGPGRDLGRAESVVQAQHPLEVVDGGKVRGESRADLLGRAIGGPQLPVPVLQCVQLGNERVVLTVADGRRILDVIAVLVCAHLFGKLGPLVADIAGNVSRQVGHSHILPHGSADQCLLRPIITGAPKTTAAPTN